MAPLEIARAERLAALPPYLFAEIDRMAEEERARGADIIDLGVVYLPVLLVLDQAQI